MKKIIVLVVFACITTMSIFAQETEKEQNAIKSIIQTAYVDGLQNKGELKDIENGFHPGFNLLGINHNMLTKFPIYSWIESFEKRKSENPEPPKDDQKITCDYITIDITGNAAMAKIQLKRNNELLFTDYLQLYKFEEGWKIVSKIYYRH
ncbi:MAG: nuclear transport factor 2 family protein [Bacteroidales bacterium]|nr:nuclear transport factor 2 family protein [Bacteroidales bacterium]